MAHPRDLNDHHWPGGCPRDATEPGADTSPLATNWTREAATTREVPHLRQSSTQVVSRNLVGSPKDTKLSTDQKIGSKRLTRRPDVANCVAKRSDVVELPGTSGKSLTGYDLALHSCRDQHGQSRRFSQSAGSEFESRAAYPQKPWSALRAGRRGPTLLIVVAGLATFWPHLLGDLAQPIGPSGPV